MKARLYICQYGNLEVLRSNGYDKKVSIRQ